MRYNVQSRLHCALILALAMTGLFVVQAPSVALADALPDGHASGALAISQAFGYVGTPQTWTAPSGVTSVVVTARGAQGSAGESPVGISQGSSAVATSGGAGGRGGQVTGRIAVTGGSQLTLVVGGEGTVRTGGYNGGGDGGLGAASGDRACGIVNSTIYQPCRGGGGGGASDVRVAGAGLEDRLLVAGGGGGGGGGYAGYWPAQPGGNGNGDGSGPTSTNSGSGGNGAQGTYGNTYPPTYGRGGGGGGGGHLGGSGAESVAADAAPSGGGGGTDHVAPALTESTIVQDANTGNGSVTLAYEAPADLQLDLSSTHVRADGTDAVTAALSLTAGDVAMPGQPIAITADRGVAVSNVNDHGDGTYTATLSGAGLATSVGAGTVTATAGSLVGTRALEVQSGPAAYVVLTTDRGALAPSDTTGATLTARVVDAGFHAVPGAGVELTRSSDASSTTMTEAATGTYTAQIDAQPTDTTYTATTGGTSGSVVIGSRLGAGSAAVVRTFVSTDDEQTWTVPTGVNSANVVARGAAGGDGLYGQGGRGAQTAATVAVSPGRSLVVMVGGAGGKAEVNTQGSYRMTNGGFNGGGSGCAQYDCLFGPAYNIEAGGGGASDLRLNDDLGSRLVVAGGGGGSARFGGSGGDGGAGPLNATPGQGDGSSYAVRRPGGGGGYLGGASMSYSGGGGGSNFVLDSGPLAATGTSTQNGGNTGTGSIAISFLQPATLSATSPVGRLRADGTSTIDVTAALLDADGNPLNGGQVSAAVDHGATASDVVANGDGTYTTTITAGTTRSDLTVTLSTGNLSATATVVQAPSRVALALSSPTVTGDGTSTVTATATFADGDDGGVGTETVTIGATGGHTNVGPVADHGDGTYTATITSTRALGTDTVTASNGDLSATASLEVVHGPVASFNFSDQGSVVAGTPATVTVTAHDAFGHVATSYAGSPDIVEDLQGSPTGCGTKASDGCAHAVTLSSFVNGAAILGFTAYRSTDAGHVTLTDGSLQGALAPFVVAPQTGHHLTVAAPSSPLMVGKAGSVTITLRDRYENLVPTQTSDLALTSSDQDAIYPATPTIAATDHGSKTVSVTLGTAGTQTLTAFAPGLAPGTATLAGHLAPTITSADLVTFRAGDDGQTFTVTTTAGFPGTRTIGISGDLPHGLGAVVDQAAGTISISGVPSARDAGRWGLTVTASNDAGMAVQHLVIGVTTRPRFLTAAKAYATRGKTFAFRASATGSPHPILNAGRLPAWLKVTRLAGGRVKLHGAPKKVGTYSVVVTATSSAGTVTQTLKVVVRKKKAPGTSAIGTNYSPWSTGLELLGWFGST